MFNFRYTTDVQPVYHYTRKIHEQNLQLKTDMLPYLQKWEEKSAEFKIGHDGSQQSKLLKTVKLNFTRYGHMLADYNRRKKIRRRRPNNITKQEV